MTAAQHIERWQFTFWGVCDLLNRCGTFVSDQGEYAVAEPLYKQALEIRRKELGENHWEFARSCKNLASVHQSMGRYAEAEPLYKQALETQRKVFGEESPEHATSCSNLASLYRSAGRYAEAEPLCRQALEIMRKVPGEEHPDFAGSCNNLALLCQSTGRYAEAEPLHKQALEIFTAALGPTHPNRKRALTNYERCLRMLGGRWREILNLHGASHPYIERVLLKRSLDRSIVRENYESAAKLRDEITNIDQAFDLEDEFGKGAIELIDRLAELRCVVIPVKQTIGIRLKNIAGEAGEKTVAELRRCVEFLVDELEHFEQFQFRSLCDRLEIVMEPGDVFNILGIGPIAKQRAMGIGPDEWLAYANHVDHDHAKYLFGLANRFAQVLPTKDEAFLIASAFEDLGEPFAASALRDRFRESSDAVD